MPLRIIERVYGADNSDNAGDDIVHALSQISDYKGQYRYRFDRDCAHSNPYFHVMVFEIEGISDDAYGRFSDRLVELGIVEVNTQA
ncbi:hypothetical protein Pla8534_16920 [Lignipirellula cremea]|uniref:Uncharacterized protein n=1 Tax=Lignipirellula cremea TaxID=2528010 RepID=A0A518DPZ0_9BACT|nr:hypothetical protein Pla8534_16920 [Lignipirellula cremea]